MTAKKRLDPSHPKAIWNFLKEKGGQANSKEIADYMCMSIQTAAQALSFMTSASSPWRVVRMTSKGPGFTIWKAVKNEPSPPAPTKSDQESGEAKLQSAVPPAPDRVYMTRAEFEAQAASGKRMAVWRNSVWYYSPDKSWIQTGPATQQARRSLPNIIK